MTVHSSVIRPRVLGMLLPAIVVMTCTGGCYKRVVEAEGFSTEQRTIHEPNVERDVGESDGAEEPVDSITDEPAEVEIGDTAGAG